MNKKEFDTTGIFDYINDGTDMEGLIVPEGKRGEIKDSQGTYQVRYLLNHPCLVQAIASFKKKNDIVFDMSSTARKSFEDAFTQYLKENGLSYAETVTQKKGWGSGWTKKNIQNNNKANKGWER